MWAADQTAGERRVSARAPERSIRVAGDWTSDLRSPVGSGSPSAYLSGDTRDATTEADHYVPECSGDAGYLRHAARWISISSADCGLSACIRGDHLFRNRHANAEGGRHAPCAIQLMREARIWYSPDPNQALLPGGFENEIVLSNEFFREVTAHSIPTDLEAAKALSSAPAALDLFMWLSYRCFTAKGRERIPIFGDFGLAAQLGSVYYAWPRKFRERLERWLDLVLTLWPACPARITGDGSHMLIRRAMALAAKGA